MVKTAGLPGVTLTVGSPGLGATALPVAVVSGAVADLMSSSARIVSVAPAPICWLPWAPNASAGVIATSTRLPTFSPTRLLVSPGSSRPPPRSMVAGALP